MVTGEETPDSERLQVWRIVAQFEGTGPELAAMAAEFQATAIRLGGSVLHAGIVDPTVTAAIAAREAKHKPKDAVPFITPEHPLYDVLGLPLGDLLDTYAADQKDAMCVRLYNNLAKKDITNLRDIILQGRANLLDIPNLGSGQMEIIKTIVGRATNGQMELLDTVDTLAKAHYCTELSEIRAAAIDDSLRNYSVQEVLDAESDVPTLLSKLPRKYIYNDGRLVGTLFPADYFPDVFTKLEAFAEEFTAARAQIELAYAIPTSE